MVPTCWHSQDITGLYYAIWGVKIESETRDIFAICLQPGNDPEYAGSIDLWLWAFIYVH